jgi:hypothetical protein
MNSETKNTQNGCVNGKVQQLANKVEEQAGGMSPFGRQEADVTSRGGEAEVTLRS